MSGLFGSKKQTIGYKYYLGMHMAIVHKLDTLNEIKVGDKVAWKGRAAENTIINIQKNELFGGDRSEGGVSGELEVLFGEPDQGPNAYLSSQVPGGLPNFRGVVSVVLRHMYLGTNPYLKKWAFRGTRVYTFDHWYDAKAPIGGNENGESEGGINSPRRIPIRVAILMDKSYSMNMQVAGQRKWDIAVAVAKQIHLILQDLDSKGYSVSLFFGMYNDYAGMVHPDKAGNIHLFNKGGPANIGALDALSILVQDVYYPTQPEMQMPTGIDGPNIGMRENMYYTAAYDGRYLVYLESESYIRNTQSIADFFNVPGESNNGVIMIGNLKIGGPADTCGTFEDYRGQQNYYYDSKSDFAKALNSSTNRYFNPINANLNPIWNVTNRNNVKFMPVTINTDKDEECQQPMSPTYQFQQESETNDRASWTYINNPYVTMNRVGPMLSGLGKTVSDFKSMMRWDFEDDGSGGGSFTNPYEADMNPAHIIRECLRHPKWGMGYPATEIDDTSFVAAADIFYEEQLGLSLLLDKEMTIEEFVKEILRHVDAALYIDRRSGLFKLKPIRDDYDEASLLVLDESNIMSMSDFSKPNLGELVNSITVNTWDKANDVVASTTVQNSALFMVQGAEINTKIQYPGITNKRNAILVAQRDLKSLSTALVKCTIECTDVAEHLNMGDVFKLSWDDYGINQLVMRIVGISYGTDLKHRVRIQAVQDVFATPVAPLIAEPEIPWVDPTGGPTTPVTDGLVMEAPYYELVQQLGQVQVDLNLNASPEMGLAMVAAVEPLNAQYSVVYVQNQTSGAMESVGTTQFSQSATLNNEISYLDDVIEVSVSDANAAKIAVSEWANINREIIFIVSKSRVSDGIWNLTVKRGCLDTQPSIIAAGTPIYFTDAYNFLYVKDYTFGENIQVELSSVGFAGETNASDRFSTYAQFKARAFAPYPPQNVKINGEYYNFDELSTMELTWAYRNRVQQTGTNLLGFVDASLSAPEAGTTYTVRLQDNTTQAWLYTVTGITGNSHTIPQSSIPFEYDDVTLFIISTRDGKDCMMPYIQKINLAEPIGGNLEFVLDDFTAAPSGGNIDLQFV